MDDPQLLMRFIHKMIDNGEGMNEETCKRIFEPFFTTKFAGRGLGMAAAFGIVNNHNGTTLGNSRKNQSTTVAIFLPVVHPPQSVPLKPKQSSPIQGKDIILLIDDELGFITVNKSMLHRLGYSVIEATTGAQALSIAQTHKDKINLALLDVMIPDIRGDAH